MLKTKFYIALCLFGLVCVACQPKGTLSITDDTAGFSIDIQEDITALTIHSPWKKGEVMQQFSFSQPYERIVCTSATHIGFINELGMKDKVVGVCTPELIYSLCQEEWKHIANIGNDVQLNLEALVLCRPDIVILSSYGQGDDRAQQIEALGIPVVYCYEWTEHTPLARAEWIRMFGAVLGCLPKADSVFTSVKEAYEQLKVDSLKFRSRSIMSGMSWRGTWYVPAGGTFMGRLFRDAGVSYKYEENPSTSSIPLTMEQALQDFSQADIWVGCDANSLDELAAIDKKHTWFKAYEVNQVYNFRRRCLPSGANDFWESGVVHPERILQDIQSIIKSDTNAFYYVNALQ